MNNWVLFVVNVRVYFQVYETLGDKDFTADAVMAEFINQYTDEDVENVFGDKSEHDYVRKVGNRLIYFIFNR